MICCDTLGHITHNTSFREYPDGIVLNSITLKKPFVEKPLTAEEHNVWLCFNRQQKTGVQKILRKRREKSSEYDQTAAHIRTYQTLPL